MKSITINGSKRESVGKSSTKALRNAGKVPCVLYGGESPIHFSALEIDFRNLVYTPNAHTTIIKLEDGMEINAILQDIQFHPVNDHIFFLKPKEGIKKKLSYWNGIEIIETDLELLIPKNYISDVAERMRIYKRLSEMKKTIEIESLKTDFLKVGK